MRAVPPAERLREALKSAREHRKVLASEAHAKHLSAALLGRRAHTAGLDRQIVTVGALVRKLEHELFQLEHSVEEVAEGAAVLGPRVGSGARWNKRFLL